MSNARQRPWRWLSAAWLLTASSTIGIESSTLAQGAGASEAQANGVGSHFELVFWQSVMASEDAPQYEAYLAQYPQGTFSGLARAKIASLTKSARTPVATAGAPAPAASGAQAALIATPGPATTAIPAIQAAVAPASGAGLAPFPALAAVPAPAPPPTPAASAAARTMIAGPVASVPAPAIPGAVPAVVSTAPNAAVSAAPGAAVQGPAGGTLLARLAAYSTQSATPAVAAATTASALPVRPQLAAVPTLDLPVQFCSAEERNRFHDANYVPTVSLADGNNKAAITYLDQLQAVYDARVKDHDIAGANAVAQDAGEFRPVAEQAYVARTALLGLFDRMMAVPIAPCQVAK